MFQIPTLLFSTLTYAPPAGPPEGGGGPAVTVTFTAAAKETWKVAMPVPVNMPETLYFNVQVNLRLLVWHHSRQPSAALPSLSLGARAHWQTGATSDVWNVTDSESKRITGPDPDYNVQVWISLALPRDWHDGLGTMTQ